MNINLGVPSVKIALCDDEQKEMDALGALLREYSLENNLHPVVSCFLHSEDLLKALEGGDRFDIIFLDVYMGQTNGLDIARAIRRIDTSCGIIFATNSKDHAIEGYEVRALVYLLKPISLPTLTKAMTLALEKSSSPIERQLSIKTRQGTFTFLLKDLVYAESNARVITGHLSNQKTVKFYEKLDQFEKQCEDGRFLRCHKSYLINLDFVFAVLNKTVQMQNDEIIPVSISNQSMKDIFATHLANKL